MEGSFKTNKQTRWKGFKNKYRYYILKYIIIKCPKQDGKILSPRCVMC